MKLVLDASALNSALLRNFLATSSSNIILLTDFLALETFKNSGRTDLGCFHRLVADFPLQVFALKSTSKIMNLRPRKSNLHSRLIDEKQTQALRKEAKTILSGRADHEDYAYNLQRLKCISQENAELIHSSIEPTRHGITQLFTHFDQRGINELRRHRVTNRDFQSQLLGDLIHVAENYFHEHRNIHDLSLADAIYSFDFRFLAAQYALAVRWTADGGIQTARDSKIGNDLIDMTYVAYGTLFDGILTQDRKLSDLYDLTRRIVRSLIRHAEFLETRLQR